MDTNREYVESSKELMLKEYDRLNESFIKNEQDGHTRINLFITLTTTLMGAFGISKQLEQVIPIAYFSCLPSWRCSFWDYLF